MYRVVEMVPNIEIMYVYIRCFVLLTLCSSVDVQLVDSTTLSVQVTTINTGIVSSSANNFNVSFVVGDSLARSDSAAIIYAISLPSMPSAGEQSFSFSWDLDDSFAGYLYGFVTDMVKSTQLNEIRVPVLAPLVSNGAYSGRIVNDSSIIDVTAQISNPVDFICGNITIPVTLNTVNAKSGLLVPLDTKEVTVSGNTGIAQVKFSVPESAVLGSFAVVASVSGTSGVTYTTSNGACIYLLITR